MSFNTIEDDVGRCVEAFVNHYMFKSWDNWLYEYLDRWTRDCRRCDYFFDLTDMIIKDYDRNGYRFIHGFEELTGKIMVWAYTIDKEFSEHYGNRLIIPGPKHRNSQKDKEEYDQKFRDSSICNYYSQKFNDEALFNSQSAKDYFWLNLAYFLYRLIDITNSPHIKRYDEEERRAKEEEIERLLHEGILTVDSKGRLKKSDKTDPEDYELSNDRD